MLKRILLIAVIAVWGLIWWSQRSISHPPGVLAPKVPSQVAAQGVDQVFIKGSKITFLADFTVNARVLSKKRYRMDRGAKVSPYDLALGWGPMSDSEILDQMEIRQAGRFFMWSVDQYPIPANEITVHASNMHIIPADAAVMAKLRAIRRGHVVTISGHLVMVNGEDGGVWLSSLTRSDSGDGACEVVYAEEITIH
ncbi:MAG: hypothetical protein GY835_13240 [bacterium]|nr:hypothetical protein [bacterium]